MSVATLDSVFIVDDDPATRESMVALIQSHGLQAESFESGEDFLSRFDRSKVGCLIIDVRMGGMSGLELQERLVKEGIELPVIIITGYGDIPTAVRAMRNGAATFLEKASGSQKMWDSISQALANAAASRESTAQKSDIRRRMATLTPDERRVLEKLLDGCPNKTIARELDLGLRTVELRRAMILQKMQASSLVELVRMVVQVGPLPGQNSVGREQAGSPHLPR